MHLAEGDPERPAKHVVFGREPGASPFQVRRAPPPRRCAHSLLRSGCLHLLPGFHARPRTHHGSSVSAIWPPAQKSLADLPAARAVDNCADALLSTTHVSVECGI